MVQPDIKGSVIRNANPKGCHEYLNKQWERLLNLPRGKPYQSVLVIGSSSGFGLATRMTALRNKAEFSAGVCFERAPTDSHSGSAGWHMDAAFHALAGEQKHTGVTFNEDAFLDSTKQQVIDAVKASGKPFDLVIYSLAAGVKLNARGEKIRSSILPTGQPLKGFQLDLEQHSLTEMELPCADDTQISDTVAVMGGQDWHDWIQQLSNAGVLATNCDTFNYSYLGSELNAPIYREGTLGAAKIHMHDTAELIRKKGINASAVVCKALVTKASLFIPLMAPYLMALKTELGERKQDENVFDQMHRLLCGGAIEDGQLLRLDNYELDPEVQAGIGARLKAMTAENFQQHMDYHGIRNELLEMHGF